METEYDEVDQNKLKAKPFPLELYIIFRMLSKGLATYGKTGNLKTSLRVVGRFILKSKQHFT